MKGPAPLAAAAPGSGVGMKGPAPLAEPLEEPGMCAGTGVGTNSPPPATL